MSLLLVLLLFGLISGRPRHAAPLEVRSNNIITCDICKAFVELLELAARLNWGEAKLFGAAADLCAKLIPDFGPAMCSSLIEERFGPVIWAILKAESGHLPGVCEFVGACHNTTAEVDAKAHAAHVAAPSKKPTPKGEATKFFVQLSDLHYDSLYVQNATQNCPFSLCCRAEMGYGAPGAGLFGSYGDPTRAFGCDAPSLLLESAMEFIRTLPTPEAILLTGDYVAHDIWQNNVTELVAQTTFSTNVVRALPGVPVLPVVGNHEWYPADQFVLPSANSGTQTEALLEAYAELWSFLGVNETASLRAGGFYSTLINEKLRYVAMNSQYGDMINFWLYAKGGSTGGPDQQAWLLNTLTTAQQRGEKVIVASHIPCTHNAGVHDFYCKWLIEVLSKFESSIVMVLAGHTHDDAWVPLTDSLIQFVTPSITPFTRTNPALRVFATTDAYDVVRIDTYYLDLAAANAQGHATWQLEYSMPEDYQMPDLSVASFNALSKQILNNSTRWNQFATYYFSSMASSNPPLCESGDSACKLAMYCTLTSPLSTVYDSCIEAHS